MTRDEIIAKNVEEFREAMSWDTSYSLSAAGVTGFLDGGWKEFSAECEAEGYDPEDILAGVKQALGV